jgi:APA family basic amino acid/polyamine antiporter
MSPRPTPSGGLSRILGARTSLLVGLGVAIGSGILRTPPLVARELEHPGWILLAWALGGLAILASSLVMAELATRFPESGGEYAWLREAFGPFVAFFFGWGYTVFMVAGGVATIAAAFGDAAVELMEAGSSRSWAAAAVAAVAAANMAGLRSGAALQDALTMFKVAVVAAAAGFAFSLSPEAGPPPDPSFPAGAAWVAALPPVIWAYAGSTDAVKLSGEIERPERAIPRALLGATFALTVLYLVVNAGLLWGLGPRALAESHLPVAVVAERAFGAAGEVVVSAGSAVVFLGALSSTLLATTRVAWALGRDGYGFGFLGRMSQSQAPVGALALVGAIAFGLALARDFEAILRIYFFAGAILFGLVYLTLPVFRARERRDARPPPDGVFRCPGAGLLVGALVLVQAAMAVNILLTAPGDALATLGLLAGLGGAYLFVRR